MRPAPILLLVTVAAASQGISAASGTNDSLCEKPTGFARFACDSRALGRRLLLREPGDGYRALGVLGAAGFLYLGREEIHDYVLDHRSPTRTNIYEVARNLGKGAAAPLLAGALYLTGKVSRDSYHTESAQIVLESAFYSAVLAGTGQFVIASERPRDGTDVQVFRTGGHGVSADVALAAGVVAPLDRRYLRFRPGDSSARKFFKVLGRTVSYTAVALTAMERMDRDAHWAPDVFLGAAAGLAAGYSISSAHEPMRTSIPFARGNARRPELIPTGRGLALAWSF